MIGDLEMDICYFCQEYKPVIRTYLYPSRYTKPEDPEEYLKLNNEGDYFIVVRTCADCGQPKID